MSRIERALSRAVANLEENKPLAAEVKQDSSEELVSNEIRLVASTVDKRLVAFREPDSAAAEYFRRLKIKLRLLPKRTRSILFTSALKGEGKSTIWLNLAVTMARDPKFKVIAVDADLRQNELQHMIPVPDGPGLTDIVRGDAQIVEAVRPTSIDGLQLLPAGSPVTDPVELLSMPEMAETLRKLTARCDCVLIDGPPVLAVTDSTVLGTLVDSVVLVVRAFKTSRTAAEKAISLLDKSNVVGFVLNRAAESGTGYYYKYYGNRSRKGK